MQQQHCDWPLVPWKVNSDFIAWSLIGGISICMGTPSISSKGTTVMERECQLVAVSKDVALTVRYMDPVSPMTTGKTWPW